MISCNGSGEEAAREEAELDGWMTRMSDVILDASAILAVIKR